MTNLRIRQLVPEILRNCWHFFFRRNDDGYNDASIRTGHVPYLWKISTVRISRNRLSAYWPVPILGKSWNALWPVEFVDRLPPIAHVETNSMASRDSGKSTIHALDQLMCAELDHHSEMKSRDMAASIDIKGAFHHAWNPGSMRPAVAKTCPIPSSEYGQL
ncbi:hypothetical protein DERF_009864 [Dermatophagoides farinae]|uniref:Uncharacterized protein n=1 Tax=Dermatophagoides farinae TaxID=6954 RepID=A0A922HY50_DERFA|nr:hypothetical protein DERF_009864 [Dermatophagoides farinae]